MGKAVKSGRELRLSEKNKVGLVLVPYPSPISFAHIFTRSPPLPTHVFMITHIGQTCSRRLFDEAKARPRTPPHGATYTCATTNHLRHDQPLTPQPTTYATTNHLRHDQPLTPQPTTYATTNHLHRNQPLTPRLHYTHAHTTTRRQRNHIHRQSRTGLTCSGR